MSIYLLIRTKTKLSRLLAKLNVTDFMFSHKGMYWFLNLAI